MTSYNLLNGTHTSQRLDLIEDFLCGECGFGGIVMTYWIMAGDILSQGAHYPQPTAAGGDLVMPGSKKDYENVLQALKADTFTRTQMEKNATRVVQMIKKLC